MTALTLDMGKFVAGLQYKDIPEEAIPFIHTAFADCVGVMIAGAGEPAPQILKSILRSKGTEATLLFGDERGSALDAAWINGTAAHALDYDDVAQRGHPTVVIVPAILAEAEAIGASGREMATAYAAGYEIWAELVRRDPDHQHQKGWHPTGIFGAVGAAAACASLHKLNAQQSACAIGIGASQSAGLISNFGSMTKPFHAGRSAHAGVVSARLAKEGFTASLDAIEHPPGFLAAISVNNRCDVDSPVQLGTNWSLPRDRFSVKKYPLCFATHSALDGMLDLLRDNRIDAGDVKRITVGVNARHAMVLRNHNPRTSLEAKFSMEFAMSCAVIAKRAGLAQIADAFVCRPDVQALMTRVTVAPTEEDPQRPGFGINDQITVETTDGRELRSRILTEVRGGPGSPLNRAELWEKFEGCVQAGGSRVHAESLFNSLMTLSEVANARDLFKTA